MKVTIRPMKFHDITQVKKVNEECLAENYTREFWESKFHECKNHSFVAVYASDVIGYIFCDNKIIISFAILDKFRGKGIGKQLLYHCLNTLDNPVMLHVRVSNEAALKLYRLVGFQEDKKLIEYYKEPVEDAFEMKWLPDTKNKYVEMKKLKIKK